jgi:membrane-associated phospholipid phosphatase
VRGRWFGILLLFVVLFCTFSYYFLDIRIACYFRSIDSWIQHTFEYITELGKSTWYLIISAVLFLAFKYFYKDTVLSGAALFVFLSITISGLTTDLLKYLLGRYRPNALFDQNLYGFAFFEFKYSMVSFPSGHANTITAVMLALYFLIPKYGWLCLIIAVMVIASRVVLCEHYLSDVVFGSYLAILTTVYLKNAFVRNQMGAFPVTLKAQAL